MRHLVRGTWYLILVVALAACGEDEPESLRDALARLSEDSAAQDANGSTDRLPATDPAAPDTGDTPAEPAADTIAEGEGEVEDAREWTAGIVEQPRSTIPTVTLREVRAARNEGFDRVVFEFDDGRVPGYHTEYVDQPVRECGSGEEVDVAGDGWLLVRLAPARAHEFQGEEAEATITDRDRELDYPVLRQLTLICDFEGQVEWVFGVSAPNRYRVTELSEPARLVVDVRH